MRIRPASLFCVVASSTVLCSIIAASAEPERKVSDDFSPADLRAFVQLEPIDTHAHVFAEDATFSDFLRQLHLHLLDIVVANKTEETKFPDLESKIAAAKAFVRNNRAHAALATTFDPFQFSNATFGTDAVRQLNRDFADGAVAVKIWKNVGMELKDQSGRFVMPDDPHFEPIYKDIAAHDKTLIAHLAEPDSCWQPPNKNSPDYSYYNEHPEWYMFKQPDHPKKAAILQARDRILQENPGLRVVGAHLGSLEMDLDGLGQRLDRYPNFAVDVAARTVYLAVQPRDKVRQFLIKYQDRIVYGTDLGLYSHEDAGTAAKEWRKQYATDWAFFASGGGVSYNGRQTQGLALPPAVLRKLYHDNAVHWIHGLLPQADK